jgi:hypothetical protein
MLSDVTDASAMIVFTELPPIGYLTIGRRYRVRTKQTSAMFSNRRGFLVRDELFDDGRRLVFKCDDSRSFSEIMIVANTIESLSEERLSLT